MNLSQKEIEDLHVKTDLMDEPLETKADYSSRIRSVFPGIPAGVIEQWFYEHSGAIEMHAWLDYGSMSVTLERYSLAQLMQSCLSEHETIVQYSNHFQKNNTSRRMASISEYMSSYGTWPVPPILLANPEGLIVTSWGLKCDSPVHLLEGHHRFAVFYAFAKLNAVSANHDVWTITKK
ncbi:hypothetical protein [Pseudomonas rossensis]|uniref:hypothetical protein n=1 Tax=Pseudomonas rossensis TaxID=2305471 RepID=UPI003261CD1C